MVIRSILLLVAFALSACSDDKIIVVDAETTEPEVDIPDGIYLKTLNMEARIALDARNEDALVAVFNESGVTLYGAPTQTFTLESLKRQISEAKAATNGDDGGLINDVVIKTFANSPLCQTIFVNGHPIKYGTCPEN